MATIIICNLELGCSTSTQFLWRFRAEHAAMGLGDGPQTISKTAMAKPRCDGKNRRKNSNGDNDDQASTGAQGGL